MSSYRSHDYVLSVYSVHYVSAVLRILMFITALVLHLLCKKYGLVTSGLLFYFWTSEFTCQLFVFMSAVNGERVASETTRNTAIAQFALVVPVWIFSCWADPKPKHIDMEGKWT